MPNKTISVPDDVLPIIDSLDVPFSRWVPDQLRRHSASSTLTFAQQLVADAAPAAGERLNEQDALAVGERMERFAVGEMRLGGDVAVLHFGSAAHR